MRIFTNLQEALFEVERDLVEMGIDNKTKSMQNKNIEKDDRYHTKELIGYSFKVKNIQEEEMMKAITKFTRDKLEVATDYCLREIEDRTKPSASNPGNSWEVRPSIWKPFLKSDGRFDYTYSERMYTTLFKTLELLKKDPFTRQAVIPIFRWTDHLSTLGKRRIPCSLSYQIIIRKGKKKQTLTVLYVMRSCDIYTHFAYDVALAGLIGRWFQYKLSTVTQIDTIDVVFFAGSLHAYKKDYAKRGVF